MNMTEPQHLIKRLAIRLGWQTIPAKSLVIANSALRGILRQQVDMSKHTSWRAGGTAERMYQPADLDDLLVFLRSLPADEPLYAVGLGSNLLVRDGGLRGTVLMLHGTLSALRLEDDGSVSPQGGGRGCSKGRQSTTQQAACGIDTKATNDKVRQSVTSQRLDGIDTVATTTLYCEAGVPGAKLARFAALHNLQGAEFFAGIPGTLGGMLAMNAGCYGSETWEKVLRVQTVNRHGKVRVHTAADYEIGYRHVVLREKGENLGRGDTLHPSPFTLHQNEWFIAAWLQFPRGDGETALQGIKALLSKRIASQPLNLPNAGSVFRNPQGDHAARLIEQCGLKGKQIGGARVSEKHANFIVNAGAATAADIENLINEVQATVEQQTGVRLQCEVRIIGEA
jgi:UDP-N-acetylmuramate dehydrogenase